MNFQDLFNWHRNSSPSYQPTSNEEPLKHLSFRDRETRDKIEEVRQSLHAPSMASVFGAEIGDHFATMLARAQGRVNVQLSLEMCKEVGEVILKGLIERIEENIGERLLKENLNAESPSRLAIGLLGDEKRKVIEAADSPKKLIAAFPEIQRILDDSVERVNFGRATFSVAHWEAEIRGYLEWMKEGSSDRLHDEYCKEVLKKLAKRGDKIAIATVGDELKRHLISAVIDDLQENLESHIMNTNVISRDPLHMAGRVYIDELRLRNTTLHKDDLYTKYPAFDSIVAKGKEQSIEFLKRVVDELDTWKKIKADTTFNRYCDAILSVLVDSGENRISLAVKKEEIESAVLTSVVTTVQNTIAERLSKSESPESDPARAGVKALFDELYHLSSRVNSAGEVHRLYPQIRKIIDNGAHSVESYVGQVRQVLDELKDNPTPTLASTYSHHILPLLERASFPNRVDREAVERVIFVSIVEDIEASLKSRLSRTEKIDPNPRSAAHRLILSEAYSCRESIKTASAAFHRHPRLRETLGTV